MIVEGMLFPREWVTREHGQYYVDPEEAGEIDLDGVIEALEQSGCGGLGQQQSTVAAGEQRSVANEGGWQ